jgi:hypothetical protein
VNYGSNTKLSTKLFGVARTANDSDNFKKKKGGGVAIPAAREEKSLTLKNLRTATVTVSSGGIAQQCNDKQRREKKQIYDQQKYETEKTGATTAADHSLRHERDALGEPRASRHLDVRWKRGHFGGSGGLRGRRQSRRRHRAGAAHAQAGRAEAHNAPR